MGRTLPNPPPALPHVPLLPRPPCDRREAFFEKVGASSPDDGAVLAGMATFCAEFGALLGEVHAFLDQNGLDDPTKV